ncbi:DUF3073 family protein [Sinosporangium siamense]|uniref:DUF3073 family protein n=1 Tax=Sinosporangium siamense TaxID=1367973 RepID=A0A919RLJ6_9ACTN|nr:DUF3073 family protein [Sinosporangium siamense]GII95998.1 hypothetical protein Ssi02_62290 [Sinosporangium siamense]
MGRGRAKAKQTRVARKLKYDSHVIDLDSLRQELNVDVAEDSEPDDDVQAPVDRQEGR